MSDYTGNPRTGASGFAIGNKGYITNGYDGANYKESLYRYDIGFDVWEKITDFPFMPRNQAISFTIGGKGYFGSGQGVVLYTSYFC